MTDKPIAYAVLIDDQLVVYDCPYCHRRHYHGAAVLGGERLSHCVTLPPKPYFLVVIA